LLSSGALWLNMPPGVAQLANLAGVTALSIDALQGCFSGFTLLYKASSASRDLSTIRVMIQLEQHKLDSWAIEVGLFDEEPVLNVNSNDAAQIPRILQQLEVLLTDVKRLKSTYKLDVEIAAEQQLCDVPDMLDTIARPPWQDRFGSSAAKVLLEGQTMLRKLRWVSVDEERVRKLLEQVRYFLGELRDYLDRAKRMGLENRVEMIYRIHLSQSTNQQYLSFASEDRDPTALGPSLNAAAKLRQKGLMLGLLEGVSTSEGIEMSIRSRTESTTSLTRLQRLNSGALASMKLSKRNLRVESLSRDVLRQLAYYNDELVMLEWRLVEATAYEGSKSRVNKITHLLHELTDPSFHSLQCIGFLEDPDMRRYGFVHVIPDPTVSSLNVRNSSQNGDATRFPISIITLQDFFDTMGCPSLNVRFQIAITIIESVMQLHTTGWLHKGLRSGNIVILKPATSIPGDPEDLLQLQMYLTGYTYARSDDPSESTEPSPAQIDAELYRHPLSLGSSRTRYRMGFDLFSVGCILLEIALWSSLSKILVNAVDGQLESQVLAAHLLRAKMHFVSGVMAAGGEDGAFAGGILKRVEAAAGEAYARVVTDCLRAAEHGSVDAVHDEKGFVLELENSSLLRFRRLVEII
jgi:hypothetical protein